VTVNADRYVPLFASEKLLAGFDGQPPFKGCGLSAAITCTGYATLGESQTKGNGRPFDSADLTNQLKVGWRAFEKVRDSNGIPDRDDAIRIHRAMFDGIPDPIPVAERDFDEIVEMLRAGWAISVACRLSVLPQSSPLRKYTSADHQIPLVGFAKGRSRRQDPMHAPSLRYAGEWVPLDHVRIAAKAIGNGEALAWRYPVGGWTQAALATEALRDRVRELRETSEALRVQLDDKDGRIVQLKADLAACRQAPGDCGPLVDNAKAAAWESFGQKAVKAVDDLRVGGPR